MQTAINFDPPKSPYSQQRRIDDRFAEFHKANPDVYDQIVSLARRAQDRGHRTIGIELLFAVLRWERMMQPIDTDGTGFKLNDHFTSRYARLIMDQEPDLSGLFRLRALRAP